MKLYEINDAIETLLSALTVDPETGEVPADIDEIADQLDSLAMERQNVLEYLAKKVLNLRSDIESLKGEINRLTDRKARLDKQAQSIINVLDRECKGEKTDLGVATVSYRKSETVDITDERNAWTWLLQNQHADCVKCPDPVVDKTALKKLLKSGVSVPGITITQHNNCSLK